MPLDVLASVIGSWPSPAILESAPGFGPAGRWSIYAARPRATFEARNQSWLLRREGRPTETGRGDPLARLARYLAEIGAGEVTDAVGPVEEGTPPFRGGLIGHLGYDLAPRIERLPRKAARESRLPDIRFALYDTYLAADNTTGRVEFHAHDLLGEGEAALLRRWEEWDEGLARASLHVGSAWLRPALSNFRREDYLAAVRRAVQYIRAGDAFQVNLSQKFTARDIGGPIVHPDPLTLYLRLRARSPAPYAAFLRWSDLAIVGASPELFYETIGRSITTRPIKGTRPRGANPAEDERLARELQTSVKDLAELTMIVDLERNDLGRVSEYGSVRVADPWTLETFAQVHHLVATVSGVLRRDVGPIDVVRAVFPGGSITGAPKIRAMEIIDELEPNRRGAYTGAVGYFSLGGRSAFNIAIRTMFVEGERVHYHVGGGIVAESDPEAEYHETMHKGRGLRETIEWPGASGERP